MSSGRVMGKLPPGWTEATIGDVTVKKVSQLVPPPDTDFTYVDISSIDNESKEVSAPKILPGDQAPSRARQSVRAGDVLVSMTRPNLNAVAIVPEELDNSIASTGFDVLRAVEVEPRWLFNLVRSQGFVRDMTALVQGALYPAIRSENVRSYKIPIPPLPEQKRIVARVGELQAHSRRAREALEAIPDLLDQLRQSVLAAAFRGDLTRKWREEHPEVELASELLKRIRIERRKRWEEAELGKLEVKGLTGEKLSSEFAKRRKQYEEPAPVDATELPKLPGGWCWARIGDAFEVHIGATPSRKRPEYWGGEYYWVSSGEVAWNRITTTREKITVEGLAETSTSLHPPGTVLLGMIGEGKTRGQAAILGIEACNNQNSAAIRVSRTPIPPEYVFRLLQYQYEQTRGVAMGNSQPALNKAKVESLLFPLLPLEETRVLVDKVESVLTSSCRSDTEAEEILDKLESLDICMLSKAFRGKLVAQDPVDEPASVLLDRVRQERDRVQARKASARWTVHR